MENIIQLIGSESSVIYYNLNKQFSTVKKVIITKDILLNSFESPDLKELILKLKETNPQNYKLILDENQRAFETNIISELYKNIQESLNKVSSSYMDVKLKDYNFMNSVSNSKFNITLRCESFSITTYYAEKGTFLSNIKNLIKEYLNYSGNINRLPRLDNFQIEIFEAEEVYKHLYLKKEGGAIILSSCFGFAKNNPINYNSGCEFYISQGNDFKFFKNKQTTAIIREHNKLVEKEIHSKEKILSNDDLVLVNEKTKNIDDALIECYLNSKNQLRILNVSVIDNSLNLYTDNGFVISKSSNNYDRVSIVTLRDNIEEETINPKYLLLKNDSEIKEFISQQDIINNIDGIILTQNFYDPILDKIGSTKNIDILYIDSPVQKSLEEKINWETLEFENSSKMPSQENPFSGIISEQNKEKDEFLERLQNIDLNSTPSQPNLDQNKQIEGLVNNIIGSEDSSFNQGNNSDNKMFSNSFNSGQKKSAIGMLADSVLNAAPPKPKPEPIAPAPPEPVQENITPDLNSFTQEVYNAPQTQPNELNKELSNLGDVFNIPSNPEPTHQPQQIISTPTPSMTSIPTTDLTKYEEILATEVLGTPNLKEVDAYFVDMNNISQVENGKVYYLTLNKDEMQNPNLNYVLPIKLNSAEINGCSLLINSLTDYFLIDENQKGVKYFVNIYELNQSIKEKFLEEIINKVGNVSVICSKNDLDIIGEKITNIDKIKVKNIEDNEELNEIKNKILSYEKRALLKK